MNEEHNIDALLRDPEPPKDGHLTRYRLAQPNDAARQHLSSCTVCRTQYEALESERRDFLARAPATTLRLPEKRRPLFLFPAGLAAAIALIAAVVLLRPPEDRAEDRTKGSAELRVFLRRGEQTRVASSGEGFQAGDALRLEISAPPPAHVWVFLRAGGTLTAHYEDVKLERSPAVLEGSLELDAAMGSEHLLVVVSETPLDRTRAEREAEHTPLAFEVTRKTGSAFDASKTREEHR
jgi:hypothetical protein